MNRLHDAQAAPAAPSPVRRLHAIFPQACEAVGIASVPLDLCDAIARDASLRARYDVSHWVATARGPFVRKNQRGVTHPLLAKIVHKFAKGTDLLRRRTVRRLIAACRSGDVVIVYPGLTADETDALRDKGAILVHDPVNTAHPHGWYALQRAYAAAGIAMDFGPDEAAIDQERRRMRASDFAFVCSPHVESSHEALGLPRTHLIRSSYGWNPHDFRPERRPAAQCRFLFVARGSVRKGLPVLLQAWERAKVKGRLILVGGVEPDVAAHCERQLRDPSIEQRAFTRDLAAVYGDADVFVLPSFEEGSPLVSYFALAAGLPSLLSPAASGWIVRDGGEGLVVEPDDVALLADALRRLADDAALRERLGAAARVRAADYTWDKAAARRLGGLEQALAIAR